MTGPLVVKLGGALLDEAARLHGAFFESFRPLAHPRIAAQRALHEAALQARELVPAR